MHAFNWKKYIIQRFGECFRLTSLFKSLETDSSSDEEYMIDGNKERPAHLDKTNELINRSD